MEGRHISINLHTEWHNIESFAVPTAKRGFVHEVTPAFWCDLERSCWLLVASPLCFFYFLELLARNDTSFTSQVRRSTILELVVLTPGTFIRKVYFGGVQRYSSARMWYESDRQGVTDLIGLRYWTLALSFVLLQLRENYDADPVLANLR